MCIRDSFGQKQPVADGDVTVPVDDGVLRDGLDRQDTFQIHGFVLHLILISLLICALCLLIALLYIRQTEIEVKDKSVDLELSLIHI